MYYIPCGWEEWNICTAWGSTGFSIKLFFFSARSVEGLILMIQSGCCNATASYHSTMSLSFKGRPLDWNVTTHCMPRKQQVVIVDRKDRAGFEKNFAQHKFFLTNSCTCKLNVCSFCSVTFLMAFGRRTRRCISSFGRDWHRLIWNLILSWRWFDRSFSLARKVSKEMQRHPSCCVHLSSPMQRVKATAVWSIPRKDFLSWTILWTAACRILVTMPLMRWSLISIWRKPWKQIFSLCWSRKGKSLCSSIDSAHSQSKEWHSWGSKCCTNRNPLCSKIFCTACKTRCCARKGTLSEKLSGSVTTSSDKSLKTVNKPALATKLG